VTDGLRFEGSKTLITVSAMLASLMAFIDISIVTVGLSEIRASFGTAINQISWVSTSYMMGNVLIMPLSGWLQKRFGYRSCFSVSILLFTLASALCGSAWSLESLVIFRALQGLGGGVIIPTAQAILFIRYPKAQHGKVGALVGLAAITGPLLGPYLGGVLIDHGSWHWMFLINIPVGLLAAAIAWRHLGVQGFRADRQAVDRVGVVLLALGLPTLQYVLEEGNREGWLESRTITACVVVSVIALSSFVVHELETPHPVLSLRLFRSGSYAAATGINFVVGITVFAGSFCFSLFCGSILGYSPINIGRALLEGNLVLLLLMPMVGKIPARHGRALIAVGIMLLCFSLWINGNLTTEVGTSDLVYPLIVRAFSIALIFVPLLPFALSGLPAEQQGNAAAMFNLSRELGGSIGIAWMTTQLDRGSTQHALELGSNIDRYRLPSITELGRMTAYLAQGDFSWDPERAALLVAQLRVKRQALMLAFNDDFKTLAFGLLVSLPCVLLLRSASAKDAARFAH
jgi:DHA2 family multidrug resistance protein